MPMVMALGMVVKSFVAQFRSTSLIHCLPGHGHGHAKVSPTRTVRQYGHGSLVLSTRNPRPLPGGGATFRWNPPTPIFSLWVRRSRAQGLTPDILAPSSALQVGSRVGNCTGGSAKLQTCSPGRRTPPVQHPRERAVAQGVVAMLQACGKE